VARKKPNSEPRTVIQPSVNAETGITLLQQLVDKANDLYTNSNLKNSDIQAWKTTAHDFLVRVFGSDSPNINSVRYADGDEPLFAGMSDVDYSNYLRSGMQNKIKVIKACIEQLNVDIQLRENSNPISEPQTPENDTPSNKVFVVHGHDEGLKETVARFLEKLNLAPIVLHEKPNKGRTIIEKFSDYSDVHFAVVLLTADDEGKSIKSAKQLKPRARQNVVLELGFFLGKLGRAKVCALYEKGVEIPSDYEGVLFLPLEPHDSWKFSLVRELKAAGFSVDANQVFSSDS